MSVYSKPNLSHDAFHLYLSKHFQEEVCIINLFYSGVQTKEMTGIAKSLEQQTNGRSRNSIQISCVLILYSVKKGTMHVSSVHVPLSSIVLPASLWPGTDVTLILV